jgi:TonB family protein
MKTIKIIVPILILCAAFVLPLQAQDNNKKGDVFYKVDEMPTYPGDDEGLRKDISNAVKYPEDAKKKGISGKVYITFVVNEQGKVVDSKVAREVDPSLDAEALRVMKQLKIWSPGKMNGKAVKVSYTVPINFALNDDSKDEASGRNEVFKIVEDMPELPGGDLALRKYIAANVKYPPEAKKEGIQGKVFVKFVVAKDGGTKDSEIARGVHPSLDKEALRVINALPKWKPGKQRGQAVNVQYTVPINFVLQKEKN